MNHDFQKIQKKDLIKKRASFHDENLEKVGIKGKHINTSRQYMANPEPHCNEWGKNWKPFH